jgi:hypothetical protein
MQKNSIDIIDHSIILKFFYLDSLEPHLGQ